MKVKCRDIHCQLGYNNSRPGLDNTISSIFYHGLFKPYYQRKMFVITPRKQVNSLNRAFTFLCLLCLCVSPAASVHAEDKKHSGKEKPRQDRPHRGGPEHRGDGEHRGGERERHGDREHRGEPTIGFAD